MPQANVNGEAISDHHTAYAKESISLDCHSMYARDLQTKFTWQAETYDGNLNIPTSRAVLANLKRNNIGKYTCSAKDDFGTFSTSFYLDVECE